MSVEDVHAYPPSRVLTQDLNFQRAAYYPDSNGSTDSLEAPSLSTGIMNSPSWEKLYKRVFNKLKEWFNRFLSYLS